MAQLSTAAESNSIPTTLLMQLSPSPVIHSLYAAFTSAAVTPGVQKVAAENFKWGS